MSCYPILMKARHLAGLDGLTPRRERYMFQRGTQPGALTFDVGTKHEHMCVETTVALEARGMCSADHRRYLKSLPDVMSLDDAAHEFNLRHSWFQGLGVDTEPDGDGVLFVRLSQAFEALGLDVSLLGTPDN